MTGTSSTSSSSWTTGTSSGPPPLPRPAVLGHISGNVGATGSAVADIHNVGAGDSLESLTIDVVVAGNADVLAHVKFDPDTAGRLACTFGWEKDLKTRVSVAPQPLRLTGPSCRTIM